MPNTIEAITDLLLDPMHRDAAPRVGQIGHARLFSQATSINEAERTIDFVCSTGGVDRYGEIVEPEAFRGSIGQFMKCPAFPYGHSYEAHDGKTPTIGHWRSLRVENNALIGTAWFKPRGLGDDCWFDFIEGNLTSVSVAFITQAWDMREVDIDGTRRKVRVFTEVDLLEISAVLIPANPHARIRAAGAMLGHDGYSLLNRLENLLKRFEGGGKGGGERGGKRGGADPGRDGLERSHVMDDAEGAMRGHAGDGDWDYFGDDIHPDIERTGHDAAEDHDEPDNHELNELLRDALSVRA